MNHHLREWMAKTPPDRRQAVAEKAGTSVGHLWQLSGGHRKASDDLAERLQDASDGEITIAGLRPDMVPLAHKILQGAAKGKVKRSAPAPKKANKALTGRRGPSCTRPAGERAPDH